MIVYKIDFTSDKAQYFSMFGSVFRSRGSAKADDRVSREDRKQEALTLKGMKKISYPDDSQDAPKDNRKEYDTRPLLLNPEGGVLELPQDAYKKIEKYLETMQWSPAIADIAFDFEEWFLAFKGEEVDK